MPHDTDAERATLGAAMVDARATALVCDLCCEECFYSQEHRLIFAAIAELFGRGEAVDIVTVSSRLSFIKQLEDAGGAVYVARLGTEIVTSANVEHYLKAVTDCYQLRRVIDAAAAIHQELMQPGPDDSVAELVARAEQRFFEASRTEKKDKLRSIRDIAVARVGEYAAMLERGGGITGLPTGFAALDQLTAGCHKGELTVIAARPSMGKSALALNMASNMAVAGHAVAVFSLEMTANMLFDRMVISATNINGQTIRSGSFSAQDLQQIVLMGSTLKTFKLYIDETSRVTTSDIRSRLQRISAVCPIDAVFVDYMQIMQGIINRGDTREREISQISGGLKAIAKDMNIPVIAMAQLNRDNERTGKKGVPDPPRLSNLRESGAIEQDADTVILIHRPGYYAKDIDNADETMLIVAKQRNGPTDTVIVRFDQATTTFRNIE